MERNDACPIWGTPARILEKETVRDYEIVDSPRTGGDYWISRTAIAIVKDQSTSEKILLTDWLIEQRRLGNSKPNISTYVLEDIINRTEYSVLDRADGLLFFMLQNSSIIGSVTKFCAENNGKDPKTANSLLAWTSSQKISEVITLAEYLDEQNFIKHRVTGRTSSSTNTIHEMMLKPQGYKHLSDLQGINKESENCFVAMWFSSSMDKAYYQGISPAIEMSGYKPVRVSEIEHSDNINDRIIAEIKRARFIIADFTSEKDKPRGGVYYEAGFAKGLNIPVIWTCREDMMENVHFDTKHFNHITWKTPEDLKEKLTIRIAAVVGDGPSKK